MSKYKIIGGDQKEYGPVGLDEIRVWLHEGRANAQSLVLPDGAAEWQPLGAIPELAALIAAVAAAPAPFSAVPMPVSIPKNNSMAVAGFACSLFGAICCLSTIFSILGLIFSIVGLTQIRKNPGQKGQGLAVAGIVISILGLIGAAIGWVWFVASQLQGLNN